MSKPKDILKTSKSFNEILKTVASQATTQKREQGKPIKPKKDKDK